ncbi:MAG: VanZ family protein [Oscillospiraceae bacterium]|nr:VanZ family protein [Oscillospiraceae bacterium]
MSYYDVILLLLVFSLALCILHILVKNRAVFRFAMGFLVFLWLAAVLSETLFLRSVSDRYDTNWRPLASYISAFTAGGQRELLRSNFMNAVLFYPAGFIAALILPKTVKPFFKLLISFFASLVLSTAIELLQFSLLLGNAQTDDIIHNVAGAVIGTGALIIFEHIHNKKQKS